VADPIDDAIAALRQEHTVRGLLETACRELTESLDASACAISRVVGDLLIGLAEFSRAARPLSIGHEYLISDYPLTQEVIAGGEPRVVSLLEDAPEPTEAELLEQLGFESLLMVCLPSGGTCWGLVEIYGEGARFDAGQAGIAHDIAIQAGRQLEQIAD
jgi:GAF domain-containing protein